MRSSLTCPLFAMGRPIGMLFFSSRRPGTYQDAHADAYVVIAEQVSMIVEKGRLYEELQQANAFLAAEIAERKKTEAMLRLAKQELEAANSKLDRLASRDQLTGIANRRAFEEAVVREWKRCTREGKEISLIMVDVDHFKSYNDLRGHQAGDDCLRRVATILDGLVARPADLVARYGGEEFVVLLPDTGRRGAVQLANQMCGAVESHQIPHGRSPTCEFVTISLGVGVATPRSRAGLKDLVLSADRCLYSARRRVATASTPREETALLSSTQ